MKPLGEIAGSGGVALLFGTDHACFIAGISVREASRNPTVMARAALAAHGLYGHDLVVVHSDAFVGVEAAGGRVAWSDSGPPRLASRPSTVPGRPLDPWRDGRLPVLLEVASRVRQSLSKRAEVAVSLTGPFTLAASVVGEAEALHAIRRENERLHTVMAWAEESACAAVKAAAAEGLGVMVAEPLAGLLGPRDFMHAVAAPLRRVLAQGGDIVHICGDSSHLLPIMPSLGGSAFSLDRVDLTKALQVVRGRTLMGGPSSDLIHAGPPELVRAAAGLCRTTGGRLIPCNGCDLVWDTPAAHVRAFVEGARIAAPRCRTECDRQAPSRAEARMRGA